MAFKRCACCGAYLDPGEHCDCDDYEQPEREMARRPVARQRTVYPREHSTEAYTRQKWQNSGMR